MVKKFIKSELGKGTIIMFITMNIFNFLNFLFHFIIGRQLGPSDYGTLAVLMSMIYIFNIPTEAIQNIVSRYTSKFNLNKENGKINFMLRKMLQKGFIFAIIIFVIISIISILLSYFLKISFFLIFLTNFYLFSSFSIPMLRGVLQGRKKFGKLGLSLIIDSALKLIFSTFLVFLGFKVFGAIIGVLLGVFIGLIASLYFNKEILNEKEEKTTFENIYSKSIPYLISMIVIYSIFSVDILLAKRFFSPEIAGQYAALSMLGKIIFFGTFAISKAMFPFTSERFEVKKDSLNVFKKSFIIVLLLCLISVLIYYLMPNFLISILYGEKYLEISSLLVYSSIALSLLSLTNLIITYNLSINSIKRSEILFIFLIIEIILLFIFNKTILEYILAFMASTLIIFIGTVFLMFKWNKK